MGYTMESTTSGRLAICCIRPDLTNDRERDERAMRDLGVRLGYAVDDTVVPLDPLKQGLYTTIMLALRASGANAVIVPDFEHIDGLDRIIRDHAQLITLEGERVLERSMLRSSVTR